MNNLKFLFPYLKKYKKKLILGFIVVTISNLCSTYIPKLIGQTIDLVAKEGFLMSQVYYNFGLILLLTFCSGLFMYLTRKFIIVASREIEYDLRHDLLYSVKLQSMDFFHRNPTGNIMAHATNDIPSAREFLGPAIMYSANTITTFLFSLYFMLALDINITLVSLIPMPFIAFITYKLGQKIHIAFRNVQEQYADLTTQAQESFSGLRVIRAFSRELYESNKFRFISLEYLKKNIRLATIEAFFMPVLMVLVGISHLIVLLYGGSKVINNQATLGELTQYFIYLEMLMWPIAAIGWITNLVQRGSASAKRLSDLINQKNTLSDNIKDKNLELKPKIEFENVDFRYNPNSNLVLNNINLSIESGNTLGIIGTVGSGKSTIINLLTRLYDVSNGEIKIDNHNIKDMSLRDLRSMIGIVPQEPFLFSDTILNNIKFGKPDATIEEVIKISKDVKLYEEILTFEKGFDTILGERGITLSGGQKQRVAIARALLKNPKILILDDSLSAIDTQTEDFILNNLNKFRQNRTSIIISHRVSSLKNSDKIIFIEQGKIIEEGTHKDLIEKGGRYAKLYKIQQLALEIDSL